MKANEDGKEEGHRKKSQAFLFPLTLDLENPSGL